MYRRKKTQSTKVNQKIISEIYGQVDFNTIQVFNNQDERKRHLVDMVDSIIYKEMSVDDQNMKKLEPDIFKWSNSKQMPFSLDTVLLIKEQ